MMTGIHSVSGSVLRRSHVSNPSISGISRSSSTSDGGLAFTFSRATFPFLASSTANPQLVRKWPIMARLSGSSSTTRMRSLTIGSVFGSFAFIVAAEVARGIRPTEPLPFAPREGFHAPHAGHPLGPRLRGFRERGLLREALFRPALPHAGSLPGRAGDGRCRPSKATFYLLYGRHRRRRLEDHGLRHFVASDLGWLLRYRLHRRHSGGGIQSRGRLRVDRLGRASLERHHRK